MKRGDALAKADNKKGTALELDALTTLLDARGFGCKASGNKITVSFKDQGEVEKLLALLKA